MSQIRFAIAGVGNGASALVQGIVREARLHNEELPILPVLGFDVHKGKVGQSLVEAIRVVPNCAQWLDEDLHQIDAPVLRGPIEDGLCQVLRSVIPIDNIQNPVDVAAALNEAGAEVLVILLPTGAQQAAERYVEAAIKANTAIVNGMPARIARNPKIAEAARNQCVAVIGDDTKAQVGATIVHRALMDVFRTRGARVSRTLQLDWGGDTDFLNLVKGRRYNEGKDLSKTEAVVWNHPDTEVHISASDFIPFLDNTKEAYMRLEGTIFANMKVRVDVSMCVQDSYNAAGMLAQAIYCAGLSQRKGVGGVLAASSAWFCKSPLTQMSDSEALAKHQAYLESIKPGSGYE